MKKLYLLIVLCSSILLANCKKENDIKKVESACGVKDPANNLSWLKDIIDKAEEDRINKTYKGRYMGTIYMEMFEGKEVFYYDELLSSCAFCSVYYCDGSKVNLTSNRIAEFADGLKKDKIIYTSMP